MATKQQKRDEMKKAIVGVIGTTVIPLVMQKVKERMDKKKSTPKLEDFVGAVKDVASQISLPKNVQEYLPRNIQEYMPKNMHEVKEMVPFKKSENKWQKPAMFAAGAVVALAGLKAIMDNKKGHDLAGA